VLRVEGFCGSKRGAVEDCHCGRGMRGMAVVAGLAGVDDGGGMADVEAAVAHVVMGMKKEKGFEKCSLILGGSRVANV